MRWVGLLLGVVVGLGTGLGEEIPMGVAPSPMFMLLGVLRLDLEPLNLLLEPAGYPALPAWQPVMTFGERTPMGERLLLGSFQLAGFFEAKGGEAKTALETYFWGVFLGTPLGDGRGGLGLALGGGYLQFTFRSRGAADLQELLLPNISRPELLFLGALPHLWWSWKVTEWARLELAVGGMIAFPGWWLDDWRLLTGPRLAPRGWLLAGGLRFDWAPLLQAPNDP